MDIFIKEYNAKVKTLEFVKKAYGKCNFGSVDSSYQYLLGPVAVVVILPEISHPESLVLQENIFVHVVVIL